MAKYKIGDIVIRHGRYPVNIGKRLKVLSVFDNIITIDKEGMWTEGYIRRHFHHIPSTIIVLGGE